MRAGSTRPRRVAARGFTLVALLVTMFLIALGLAAAAPTWAEQTRRSRERELLRVGLLYAHALADFRESSPGGLKTLPKSLDELLLDPRFFGVRRHLRQLYPDPLDPARPWGIVRDLDGAIIAVYSQSSDEPVARGSIDLGDIVLPAARHYFDWKFASPGQP